MGENVWYFLNSVFEVQYEGMYRGEYNKAKTVMFAYDDAIHGVRGKAADGRIFEGTAKIRHCVKCWRESSVFI